jgi:hypothetical protein
MFALVLSSAILLVLGVLAYRRPLAGQVQRGKRKGQSAEGAELLILRVIVLLLFASVFVGEVFTRVWVERPRRVAVMLDASQSMSAVGAERAAAGVAQVLPIPVGVERQEWVFADTAVTTQVKGQKAKARSQNGERTRIGKALRTVAKTRPGAVVLLSDGQDNGELDPVAAARGIGVPVYTVGFGGAAKRNAGIEQVLLPAVVYSGETAEVQVRVIAAGFVGERAWVRLRGEAREVVLGQAMAEQDVGFRVVFDRSGRQVIEARVDSMTGERDFADNVRSVTVDVRPGHVRVAYVTNRPGPDTRMILRALASDERIEVLPEVAVTGGVGLGIRSESTAGFGHVPSPDVYILDDVVETGNPELWQSIAGRVRAGAGVLVIAGPEFQPGQSIEEVLRGSVGRAQTGSLTPELTAEGGLLPWWSASSPQSRAGSDAIDLGSVPPFAGLRPLSTAERQSPSANRAATWLVARENQVPLLVAGKAGKGKFVYVAAYPLWRWGFRPEARPEQGTPLSAFLSGVLRYLAERDTSPFWLDVADKDLYRGQPVRLILKAVAPDGRPWTGLGVTVQVVKDTQPKSEARGQKSGGRRDDMDQETVTVPMTESGSGVYEATVEALGPGGYRAIATVEKTRDQGIERPSDQLGRATTDFVVAEQALELANTGMNEGLLRAIAAAGGGRFYPAESLPRDGSEIGLGSYQRRFTFDPRRAVWVYFLIALLAGAEWLLRRRRGLL